VEEAEALLRSSGLAVELLQLAGGRQVGDLLLLRLATLQLLRLRLSVGVHVRGPKLSGRQIVTLCLDPRLSPPLRAHGHLLPETSLFGLECRGEIHLTTAAASQLAVVLIDRNSFAHWAERLGAAALADEGLAANWVALDPQRFAVLRNSLRCLFATAETHPGALALAGRDRLAEADLMPLLVEALIHGAQLQRSLPRPPARIEIVKLAQRWMAENPQRPITLDALCRQVHAGRRSLIQGFQDHLGMGPMAFLKLQRLHGVRRQLLAADPARARIHQLAMEWGFLNAGHFARDYRLLFGERPSDTLLRPGRSPRELRFRPASRRIAPPPPPDSPASAPIRAGDPVPTGAPPPARKG